MCWSVKNGFLLFKKMDVLYTVKEFSSNCSTKNKTKWQKSQFLSTACDERKLRRIKQNTENLFFLYFFVFPQSLVVQLFVSLWISLRKGFFLFQYQKRTNRGDETSKEVFLVHLPTIHNFLDWIKYLKKKT